MSAPWRPTWAVHPGETLGEMLEERKMSQAELARRTDVSRKHISEIVNGKAGVGARFAVSLEAVLKVPAEFWVNLQGEYEVATERHRGR